jgi:hypothetical protein
MFSGNLFKNVDLPPKLSTSEMAKVSVSDVQKKLSDPNDAATFYAQLKDDPTALSTLQTNLTTQMNDGSNTPAQTVDAAQTLILVTTNGTDSSSIVNNAITQAGNLKSSNSASISAAVISLMAGKSVQQIEDSLTQFQTMQGAFYVMQMQAASPPLTGTVDSTVFFGTASAATQGDLAQTGLVAAAADAMVLDWIAQGGGHTLLTLAQAINAGTYADPAVHANMDDVSSALGSAQPVTNHYAYLSAVKSILPF